MHPPDLPFALSIPQYSCWHLSHLVPATPLKQVQLPVEGSQNEVPKQGSGHANTFKYKNPLSYFLRANRTKSLEVKGM